jgi:hypothetical protein
MQKAATGQHIASVTLELTGKSVSYKLSDVVVSADRPQATGAVGDSVVEEVTFVAAKLEVAATGKN